MKVWALFGLRDGADPTMDHLTIKELVSLHVTQKGAEAAMLRFETLASPQLGSCEMDRRGFDDSVAEEWEVLP